MKLAQEVGAGYVCVEGQSCREAIGVEGSEDGWPVEAGTEWSGLRSLTETMCVPVLHPIRHLFVMSKGAPDRMQMFLTDQF